MTKTPFKLFGLPAAATIAIGYLFIGLAWIFYSDQLIAKYVTDEPSREFLQTCNGWLYVSFTALLLYLVLKRVSFRIRQAQRKLTESEERFRLLFEQADDGIVLLGEDLGMLNCNAGACRIFGVDAEADVIGKTPLDFSSERQMDGRLTAEYSAEVSERLLGGKPYRFNWRLVQPSGSIVDTEVSCRIFQVDGQTFQQAIMRDVTEQCRAEEELLQAKQQLQYIVNNTHDIIFQVDLEGNFIYGNAAAEEVTGYELDELLSMNMRQLIAPDYHEMVFERLRLRIAGALDEISYSFEILHKDGHRVWLELETKGVFNTEGMLEAVQGVARDLTHRRAMEVELKRLSTAIDQSGEAIIITDANGDIEYVNPAFEAISGYSRVEILGENPRLFKSGQHDDDFYRDMWERISSGETWMGRIQNKRKDGSLCFMESVISPVRDAHGVIVHYVSVKRDITKELNLEEQFRQSQKMEAIGRLAGGVAHDLNNILQTILGFCGVLLLETEDRERLRQDVIEIQNAAKRAGNLTRQLLTFSRKQPTTMAWVNVNDIVENQKKMLDRLLTGEVRLEMDLAEDLKPVMADAGQIEQVIMNLVVNARDAMPNGGRMVLRTENVVIDAAATIMMPRAKPGTFVCLSLSDTGAGMDKDVLDHLFEPFYTTKPVGVGTGLGLAVLYGIVEHHRGWIHVESAPGEGSLFKIHLPVRKG